MGKLYGEGIWFCASCKLEVTTPGAKANEHWIPWEKEEGVFLPCCPLCKKPLDYKREVAKKEVS